MGVGTHEHLTSVEMVVDFNSVKVTPEKPNCMHHNRIGNDPISTRVEQWKTMAPSHSLEVF